MGHSFKESKCLIKVVASDKKASKKSYPPTWLSIFSHFLHVHQHSKVSFADFALNYWCSSPRTRPFPHPFYWTKNACNTEYKFMHRSSYEWKGMSCKHIFWSCAACICMVWHMFWHAYRVPSAIICPSLHEHCPPDMRGWVKWFSSSLKFTCLPNADITPWNSIGLAMSGISGLKHWTGSSGFNLHLEPRKVW